MVFAFLEEFAVTRPPQACLPSLFDHCAEVFAGHRGHPLRFGWLRKVHVRLQENPGLFARSFAARATTELGVGRPAQVPALRYWSSAFGLIRSSGRGSYEVTERGHWLLDDPGDGPSARQGADPWLERPESLWLLHWWLGEPGCAFPTWFQLFSRVRFGVQGELLVARVSATAAAAGWKPPAPTRIRRDIETLVDMYRTSSLDADPFEDVDHPFRALRLLDVNDAGWLRMNRPVEVPGRKAVVAYACLDYAARVASGASLSLARLGEDPAGPGCLLRASREVLHTALEDTSRRDSGSALGLLGSVGEEALACSSPWEIAADRVLAEHYDVDRGPRGHLWDRRR
ncbi:DUF4007 family protein [Embleya scabrispora]|uniref:DUF4007 family protein n=1 Tax=Embleya scabrispora TaxID=159449 RepID=UPI0026C89270|nr:DUF4007 family protein [Embleya scabrispora]